MSEERHRRWPDLLREIATHLGEKDALFLVAEFGGQRLYVPGSLSAAIKAERQGSRSRLEQRLGKKLASFLIEHYGGQTLPIPTFSARSADHRRNFVLRNPLLSANDAAAKLGITARRVEQIREEARADPDQPSLFD